LTGGVTEYSIQDVAEAAIGMYIFGTTFDIPRLRQDAMDRLVWCSNFSYTLTPTSYARVSESIILRAYEHTNCNSPLLTRLIAHGPLVTGYEMYLPDEYLHDRVEALNPVWIRLSCEYHEHKNQQEWNDCVVRVNMERTLIAEESF
jgi:hypothetical protein